jgi:hypothetical protein
MPNKKGKETPGEAAYASVTKEMAKPRMSMSARITQLNLGTARYSEHASSAAPGIAGKILHPPRPGKPDKTQIASDGNDQRRQSPQKTKSPKRRGVRHSA